MLLASLQVCHPHAVRFFSSTGAVVTMVLVGVTGAAGIVATILLKEYAQRCGWHLRLYDVVEIPTSALPTVCEGNHVESYQVLHTHPSANNSRTLLSCSQAGTQKLSNHLVSITHGSWAQSTTWEAQVAVWTCRWTSLTEHRLRASSTA